MAPKQGTPIAPGLIARASAAVSGLVGGAIRGAADAWFGPLNPLTPVAPPEVKGRAFDYAQGYNINATWPRSEQGEGGVSFYQLRALADPTRGGLDLLRQVIDKRKDQMESQDWTIRARDGSDGGQRAKDVKDALRKPDGIHTWSQWQRMFIEDLLVIDAPCAYLSPSTKGYLVPEVMDGGLIKPLIRPDGRQPLPPDPAFQQMLKGLPAVDYTADELVYMPRNLRSHRVYGMSPVEQVITTVNIGIRRQLFQYEYYTAGSVPDLLIGAPSTWDAKQLSDFQLYWDGLLSGNTNERRRARWVPGEVKPFELKPNALKDDYDEWLARIICFCFSISPQALSKQMNRATAETSKQSAQEEGLEPLKGWWKDFVDEILARAFNAPDLEMVYADEEIADPAVKATVMSTALGAGGGKPWMTQDEVREKYGLQPMTDEQREELQPAPPPQLMPGEGTGDMEQGAGTADGTAPEPPASKVAKAARRSLRPRPPAGL